MSVPTLYGISAELLNLMAEREDIIQDNGATMNFEVELKRVETAIREQVSGLVRKVDGAAFYVREFEARAAAAKAEKDRNREREHMWEARGERLKEYIIAVMQMMGATRLDGDSNTLRLQKCPASVEIVQPELVPEEMQMVEVRMSLETWRVLQAHAYNEDIDTGPISIRPSVSKSKIGEALKRGDGVPGCSLVTDKMSLRVE